MGTTTWVVLKIMGPFGLRHLVLRVPIRLFLHEGRGPVQTKSADSLHEGRCRARPEGEGWPHNFLRCGVGILGWETAWTPDVALWRSTCSVNS